MIQGSKKPDLTKEYVLSITSEYEIYRHYLGEFIVGKPICNPFRKENNPSLVIKDRGGHLFHFDYGDSYYQGDCFSLIQQIFHSDFNTALSLAVKDLGIEYRIPQIRAKNDYNELTKHYTPLIQISTRKFNKNELEYWNRLSQDISDLKRENVYVPKEIYRNRKKLSDLGLMTFCYFYPEVEKWKIYRPFAPKKSKDTPPELWKFDSNVPFNYIENLSLLKRNKRSFLAKSKKDNMVLRKILGENEVIYNVQAENPACLNEETLNKIKKLSPERYVISDSDKKGKEFSWWLTDVHGFKHINIPDKYLHEEPKKTDFSDIVYHYDIDIAREHFIKKGIITL